MNRVAQVHEPLQQGPGILIENPAGDQVRAAQYLGRGRDDTGVGPGEHVVEMTFQVDNEEHHRHNNNATVGNTTGPALGSDESEVMRHSGSGAADDVAEDYGRLRVAHGAESVSANTQEL